MQTRARDPPRAMALAVLDLKARLASADRRHAGRFALLVAIHLAAFGIWLWSEDEPSAQAAFVLTWAALNFFWLVVLRRPLTSAALSLVLIVILIALSQFKHGTLLMTATFVDVMLIVMVFDESSFDVTMMPNIKVAANYRERFRSSDGQTRAFVVEGAGGPSWYTEYNVLTGLSVRSYGRFAESVTRLAAGRVKRGLPYALRECGYSTYSLYSWFGAFAGARGFQTSTGIEHFLDAKQLHVGPADTDIFFYDQAARVIAQDRGQGPVFAFVYLAANHFPWNYHYRPDLLPHWVNPGNPFAIDEYLRRQEMSARDYAQFKERLGREFPDQQFLLVRFGDHQPLFAKRFIDPTLDQAEVAARILQRDPRYFTTYYAAEGVNFRPVDLSSALDTLDAP